MSDPNPIDRRTVIETLARATVAELAEALATIGEPSDVVVLRPAETGLVMVRGRAGGGGAAFNLGEATVTRASIALADGTIGHAYALGRDKEKAHLSALLDALWQTSARSTVETAVIAPVRARLAAAHAKAEGEAAATTVDFFTMARENA